MFENVSIINVFYQVMAIAIPIGIIFMIVSLVRRSKADKDRLKKLEEKMGDIKERMNENN
ncbi:hypothetical protein ACM26V_16470 [Salipaludibacillus sp. HK11]|uniref:hypothetical protein n=1 Tax=Salipaludibacillus sp. HK11 TaxID=3394320 RepID=UPI0039FBA1EC